MMYTSLLWCIAGGRTLSHMWYFGSHKIDTSLWNYEIAIMDLYSATPKYIMETCLCELHMCPLLELIS